MILATFSKINQLRQSTKVFNLVNQFNLAFLSFNKHPYLFSNHSQKIIEGEKIIQQQNSILNKKQKNINKKELYQIQQLIQINETKKISSKKQLKQNKQFLFFFNLSDNQKVNTISEYKQKQMIKQLSILSRQMLFERQKSQLVWYAIQQAFISFLTPTEDQQKIRSLSKMLYALGKSKRATKNYQTPMAIILPFSSHQSFTQIVTTISRMGGMSQEFSHIVQKLYWKRRQQFTQLQVLLINYVLIKNGRKIDPKLLDNLNSFSLRQIAMVLHIYDKAGLMKQQILKMLINPIIARKNQTNFYDWKNIFNIYCKYMYLQNKNLMNYFQQQYKYLKHNIYQSNLQIVWQYLPQAINANKIPISFVEQLIKTIKYFRVRNRIDQKIWKILKQKFQKIQNLQIKVKLQKL